MNTVILKGYKVQKFEFGAQVAAGTKITLQNACSYNVRYSKEGFCAGTLTCKVSDKEHPDLFFINIEMEGGFSFDQNAKREQIHVDSFKILFPYARSIVSAATSLFGITPVIIPQVDIEGQSIYRIDPNGWKQ